MCRGEMQALLSLDGARKVARMSWQKGPEIGVSEIGVRVTSV